MSRNSADRDAERFVDSVVREKDAKAENILEKIVRRKVEKHIRKTLLRAGGR